MMFYIDILFLVNLNFSIKSNIKSSVAPTIEIIPKKVYTSPIENFSIIIPPQKIAYYASEPHTN